MHLSPQICSALLALVTFRDSIVFPSGFQHPPLTSCTLRTLWQVELQEKLRIYEERAKQQPQDAGAHWSLGGLRLALGNFAGAEGAYAEAVRLEPGDEFARFGLGQAREKQGKLAAAAEAYAAAQHLGYDGGEALNRVSKERVL